MTGDDREPQVVHQVGAHELVDDNGAVDHEDVPAGGSLERFDLVLERPDGEPGVRPGEIGQGVREHHLLDIVEPGAKLAGAGRHRMSTQRMRITRWPCHVRDRHADKITTYGWSTNGALPQPDESCRGRPGRWVPVGR